MNSQQRWAISSINKRKIIWIRQIFQMVLIRNRFPSKCQSSMIVKENNLEIQLISFEDSNILKNEAKNEYKMICGSWVNKSLKLKK